MRSFDKPNGWLSRWMLFVVLGISSALAQTALIGCDEKKPPPPVVSAKPVPEEIAKLPLAELVAPQDVILFGGVDDVAKLAEPVSAITALVSPGAGQLSAQLPKIAAETLGLSTPDALDFTKPVRVAVLDPKKHSHGFGVFLLHIKDEASLIAAAPPTRAINDQGNGYGWEIQGGRVYVNIVGDVAIFAMEAGTFTANQQFFKQLSASIAPPGATLIAPAANIVSLYGPDFEQALTQMKSQGEKLSEPESRALANIVSVDESLYGALKDLDSATISLRPTDDGLVLSFKLKPRAGTGLEKTFKNVKPKSDNTLLARFPKSSPAYLAASVSPESLESMQTTMKWLLSLSLPPEQADKFTASWSDLVGASTGDFVMGGYRGKDGNLVMGGMSGVKDADKARAAQATILKMYDDPSMKAALDKAGIATTVKAKAYKIGDVDVTITKSELKTPPPGAATALLSSFLETHSAISKDAAFLAYGPSAKETLTLLVEGKSAKDGPELGLDQGPAAERAKKNGAPNAILHAYVVPSALAGSGAPASDAVGIVLTVGAKDGLLELTLDVPTQQIGPTMMALAALRGFGAGAPPTPMPSASAAPSAVAPRAPSPAPKDKK